MRVVVVTPPNTVVTAQEARDAGVFSATDDDDYIDLMLEIAQSEIDGPDGWLGRAIGEQTLQVIVAASCDVPTYRFPYPPFISTVSDTLSEDGLTRTIKYRAGYEADEVPARIKHAIILMAGTLRDATPGEAFVKSETVEGVGSKDYSLPDGAADAMKAAADRLLSTYRVLA